MGPLECLVWAEAKASDVVVSHRSFISCLADCALIIEVTAHIFDSAALMFEFFFTGGAHHL